MSMTASEESLLRDALIKPQGFRFLGIGWESAIKYFFGGNAIVAVVLLGLITVFLFREGYGFIAQSRENIRIYREAGLEFIDIMRARQEAHVKLGRQINAVRLDLFKQAQRKGKSLDEINASLAPLDAFSGAFSDSADALRGLVSDYGEIAVDIKQRASQIHDRVEQKQMLSDAGRFEEARQVEVPLIDFPKERKAIIDTAPQYDEICRTMRTQLVALVNNPNPGFDSMPSKTRDLFKTDLLAFLDYLDRGRTELAAINLDKPVGYFAGVVEFFTHPEWITASFWQDWYGVVPLFVGSLFVSTIALLIAVPLGVSAAVYVNQIAGLREGNFIKPAIEFIAAFPSVVLGFFGVAILGETLRNVTNGIVFDPVWVKSLPALIEWLPASLNYVTHVVAGWVPFFPIAERLNAMTAGILLGLMAVPTIFSLAEDAINNVPVHLKEASFALGASKLQTLIKITVPAALSGIIAAVLLGFGRVIGETMVVLLCAGNRIKIPDFTDGLGAFFQPVHTMTGIIAQEMGEVPSGSIHYRALFMVAILLFLLALLINYFAQKVVRKFKISIG